LQQLPFETSISIPIYGTRRTLLPKGGHDANLDRRITTMIKVVVVMAMMMIMMTRTRRMIMIIGDDW
jgi:hypothetical protein